MVINYTRKVIFIGIPVSASSAISKELLEHYDFEPLFHKHSNIPLLIAKRPDIQLKEYTIVAVKRDPVDVAFTSYNKTKNNAHNAYTDPKYFVENGGHVTRNARKIYTRLKQKNWSFDEYVRNVYRLLPYDNYLSYNQPYINFTIDSKNINEGFQALLAKSGLESKGQLPVYNKTTKIADRPIISTETMKSAFGPFIIFNEIPGYDFTIKQVGYLNYLRFSIIRHARNIYWLLRDKKRSKTRVFTVD